MAAALIFTIILLLFWGRISQDKGVLIIDAESRAEEILRTKRKVLDRLAETLIKEEILDRDDVERIIRTCE